MLSIADAMVPDIEKQGERTSTIDQTWGVSGGGI